MPASVLVPVLEPEVVVELDTSLWSVAVPSAVVELDSLVDFGASCILLIFQPIIPSGFPKSLDNFMSYRTVPPLDRFAVTIISDENIDCSE